MVHPKGFALPHTCHNDRVHLGEFVLGKIRHPIQYLDPHRRVIPIVVIGIFRYGPLHIKPRIGAAQLLPGMAEQPTLTADILVDLPPDRLVRPGTKGADQVQMGRPEIEPERNQ